MALPGLNLDALTVPLEEEKSSVVHELSANTEWRFEVAFDQAIEVKVGVRFEVTDTHSISDLELASLWDCRDFWHRDRPEPE